MKNNWVVFLKQKSKETGISYMCLISNKEIQNEYKKLKMKNENVKKIEPIKNAEPYPFSFSVITNQIIPNDTFNFSRDFKYKTIKTDNGYNFFFKNIRDRDIAIDLTLYVSEYKNPKLYKWLYKPVIEPVKKVEPKKVEPKKVEPKKVEPKKVEDDLKNIVNNWKDPYISTLLYQSDVYRPFIEHIEKLIEKGSGIAISQLFFRKEDKELLNKLFEKYGLDVIDDVVRKIVTDLGGISGEKYIDGYYKHLDAKNKRKMIIQQSKLL